MGTNQSAMKFITGHVLAGTTLIGGALVFMAVCYVAGIATSIEGIDSPAAAVPEFLLLMLLAGGVAIAVSTGCFLVSVLLTLVRWKWRFWSWLPLLLAPAFGFPIAYGFFGQAEDGTFALVVASTLSVCFALYWAVLMGSAAVVDFFKGTKAMPRSA